MPQLYCEGFSHAQSRVPIENRQLMVPADIVKAFTEMNPNNIRPAELKLLESARQITAPFLLLLERPKNPDGTSQAVCDEEKKELIAHIVNNNNLWAILNYFVYQHDLIQGMAKDWKRLAGCGGDYY